MGEYAAHEGSLDATGMRFAIAVARFNRDLTEQLLDGAETMLRKHDAAAVTVAWVPGAYELPLAGQRFAFGTYLRIRRQRRSQRGASGFDRRA